MSTNSDSRSTTIGPAAKLRFCGFNGVDGPRRRFAGRDAGAEGVITGADKDHFSQLSIFTEQPTTTSA